jgi:hypothetical protein
MASTILSTTGVGPAGKGGPPRWPAKLGTNTGYLGLSMGSSGSQVLADDVTP